MPSLTEYHLVGSSSSHATAKVVTFPDHSFVVAFSVAGEHSSLLADKMRERLITADVDSPASFYALMERVVQMSEGVSLELSAVYYFEEKIYLVDQNGEIWLQRGDRLGKVLGPSVTLRIVEGKLLEGDVYLCFTQSAAVALRDKLSIEVVQRFPSYSEVLMNFLRDSGLADRSAVTCLSHSESFIAPESDDEFLSQVPLSSTKVDRVQQLKDLSEKVARGMSQGISKGAYFIRSMRQRKSPIEMIRTMQPRTKKKIARGLGAVLLALLLYLFFQLFSQFQQRKANAFVEPFAERLVGLQSTLDQGDLRAARDGATALTEEYQIAAEGFQANALNRSIILAFQAELDQFTELANGRVELESLPIFYDFRLVRADFLANKGVVSGSNAIFMDKEKQVLLLLNLETKQQSILPVGNYPELKDIAVQGDQLYILADGVYEFPLTSEREAEKTIEEGDSNRAATLLGTFDVNLYAFNPESRNIFRYRIGTESGEVQPIGWFVDKTGIDFPEITTMAIDGNIWLGDSTGQILKFEKGAPVPFEVSGLSQPFESEIQIFTTEELDRIYVLDSRKERVVQISKDGTVIGESVSKELGAATGVIFSSATNKTYAIVGSLLYEVMFR